MEMLHFRPRGGGGTVSPETQKRKLDSQEMKDWAYLGSWRPAWVALDSVVSNKKLPQRKCRVFLLCLAYARSFGNGVLKAKGMLCWHTFPFIFLSERETEIGFFLSQLAALLKQCYSSAGG